MQVTINIDPNKLDYDAINKAIIERINETNIYDDAMVKFKLEDAVKRRCDSIASDYIYQYCGYPNREIKDMIADITRSYLKGLVEPAAKQHIEELGGEDEIKKVITDILPNVLSQVLVRMMTDLLINYHNREFQDIDEHIRHAIAYRLGN